MEQSKTGSKNSKFAYIVTADIRYLPEVIGNLNSLHLIGNQQDVHYFGSKIPDDVVEQFDKLCYRLIYHPVSDEEIKAAHGNSEVMCRKRYWYAAEYGQDYEAVCILDADMLWSHLPDVFFEIAAKTGLIVGASKEQNKVYNEPNHEYDVEGVRGWNWQLPHGYYNDADLCNCPTFIDARLYEDALRKQWEIFLEGYPFKDEIPDTHFRAPDMDAMNLCFLEAVWPDTERILPLPGLMFLGTNEQHFKPYINATMRENGLWTKNGIKIYSVHGHFHHRQWCGIQLSNREGCIEGQLDGSPSAYRQAEGSLADLCRYAQHCLWEGPIRIEERNYRHPDKPVEDTYIWEI